MKIHVGNTRYHVRSWCRHTSSSSFTTSSSYTQFFFSHESPKLLNKSPYILRGYERLRNACVSKQKMRRARFLVTLSVPCVLLTSCLPSVEFLFLLNILKAFSSAELQTMVKQQKYFYNDYHTHLLSLYLLL